jgi:hypothetical protein
VSSSGEAIGRASGRSFREKNLLKVCFVQSQNDEGKTEKKREHMDERVGWAAEGKQREPIEFMGRTSYLVRSGSTRMLRSRSN